MTLIAIGLLCLVGLVVNGNLHRIAKAMEAQNEYYGIFEQTSEEQETGRSGV